MVTLWDREGFYLAAWLSSDLQRIYGFTAADLVGKRIHDMYSASEATHLLNYIRKTIQLDGSLRVVVHFSSLHDGIWQEILMIPTKDSEGQMVVIGIAHDTTQIHRQEEEFQKQKRFLSLMYNDDYGYIRCNHKGKLLDTNQQLVKLLGDHTPNKLINRSSNIRTLIQPVDQSPKQFWEQFNSTKTTKMVVDLRCIDQTRKRFILYKYGLSEGSELEFHILLKDPTLKLNPQYSERIDPEYLLAILSGFQDTLINVYDREGRIISHWMSAETELKYGLPASASVVGKYMSAILPPDEARRRLSTVIDVN